MEITFVTGNKNKLNEVNQMLKMKSSKLLLRALSLDLPEYQGTSDYITEQKTLMAESIVNGPVIVEDTSLHFNALNGLPGSYIKWFYEKLNNDGLIKMLSGFDDKSAYAVCTLGLCIGPDKKVLLFQGKIDGEIVLPRKSSEKSFGWDPIFEPNGFNQTFSEMSNELKNSISHRKLALDKLIEYLVVLE